MESDPIFPEASRSAEFLVSEIYVGKLFGRYDYRISSRDSGRTISSAPPLMLLYGRNGSGKTTVLRLLLHLLSPAKNFGHRTALASIPFGTFAVRLGDGTFIAVEKENDLVGSYEVTVREGRKIVARQGYAYDDSSRRLMALERGRLPVEEDASDLFQARELLLAREPFEDDRLFITGAEDSYVQYLATLGVKPFLLGDDRRIHSDDQERIRRMRLEEGRRPDGGVPIATELRDSLRQTTEWLRQQVLTGAAQGAISADDVYREVLTQLSSFAEPEETPDIEILRRRLVTLDKRTQRFSDFGLTTRFEGRSMIQMLSHIPADRLGLAARILDPYLTGQDARLNSLQGTESLVRTLVDYLNEYFDDKKVTFTPQDGIRIRSLDNTPIPANRLSSGERQLLLLLCRAVLSRQSTTLFMIDEPELSLNAKWQRKLVQTLMDLVDGSNVQFIMATHSIEILTKHRPYLAELRTAE